MAVGAQQLGGVEALREQIAAIVALRQQLRSSGASRESLEQNRLELVHSQSELARALIDEHARPAAAH